MKSETYYLVYLDWPEGKGGAIRYENSAEAIEAAKKLEQKWANHKCRTVCLKITKKELDFNRRDQA